MEQFLHKKEISHRLFFLTKYLDNFGKLVETENFPKTSMFTGNKGQGKYTLLVTYYLVLKMISMIMTIIR